MTLLGSLFRDNGSHTFVTDVKSIGPQIRGGFQVNKHIFSVYMKLQDLMKLEEGQDLVEYALVVALIAFGAVAAMKGLSTEINTAFNVISSDLKTSL
jgi:pilus assembly protein Flp/PilA